jgi:hypothetical protein
MLIKRAFQKRDPYPILEGCGGEILPSYLALSIEIVAQAH